MCKKCVIVKAPNPTAANMRSITMDIMKASIAIPSAPNHPTSKMAL